MIIQDINYAKGWRVVRRDERGHYVRLFQDKWYSEQLSPWYGKKIWVDSYGWDAVQCWVVRFNMFICQIEDQDAEIAGSNPVTLTPAPEA